MHHFEVVSEFHMCTKKDTHMKFGNMILGYTDQRKFTQTLNAELARREAIQFLQLGLQSVFAFRFHRMYRY